MGFPRNLIPIDKTTYIKVHYLSHTPLSNTYKEKIQMASLMLKHFCRDFVPKGSATPQDAGTC